MFYCIHFTLFFGFDQHFLLVRCQILSCRRGADPEPASVPRLQGFLCLGHFYIIRSKLVSNNAVLLDARFSLWVDLSWSSFVEDRVRLASRFTEMCRSDFINNRVWLQLLLFVFLSNTCRRTRLGNVFFNLVIELLAVLVLLAVNILHDVRTALHSHLLSLLLFGLIFRFWHLL